MHCTSVGRELVDDDTADEEEDERERPGNQVGEGIHQVGVGQGQLVQYGQADDGAEAYQKENQGGYEDGQQGLRRKGEHEDEAFLLTVGVPENPPQAACQRDEESASHPDRRYGDDDLEVRHLSYLGDGGDDVLQVDRGAHERVDLKDFRDQLPLGMKEADQNRQDHHHDGQEREQKAERTGSRV